MLIIHDSRLPNTIIENLRNYGETIPFLTHNITDEVMAGHPDIFICMVGNQIIVAPNIPQIYIDIFSEKGIPFQLGKNKIGKQKQQIPHYNVVVTDKYMIHNHKYTDLVILEYFEKQVNMTQEEYYIDVSQSYTRCSLLALKDDHFLTSDQGIAKKLEAEGLDVCYVSPNDILLSGVSHGLIGGCMGIWKDQIFITGSLNYHTEGEKIRKYLSFLNYHIIELYDGPLIDGGSLFFLP